MKQDQSQQKNHKSFIIPPLTVIKYLHGQQYAFQAWQRVQQLSYGGKINEKSAWSVSFSLEWNQYKEQANQFETSGTAYEHIYVTFKVRYMDNSKASPKVTLLGMINQITFSQLKSLNLVNTNLLNIEFIPFLDINCLQSIIIQNNYITNIKALNKVKWTTLKNIFLNEQNLTKIQLTRIQMNSFLEYFNCNAHLFPKNDMLKKLRPINSFPGVMKSKCSNIRQTAISHLQFYLWLPKVYQKLQDRFPQLVIELMQ